MPHGCRPPPGLSLGLQLLALLQILGRHWRRHDDAIFAPDRHSKLLRRFLQPLLGRRSHCVHFDPIIRVAVLGQLSLLLGRPPLRGIQLLREKLELLPRELRDKLFVLGADLDWLV